MTEDQNSMCQPVSGWVNYAACSNVVIVFVHGVLSSAKDCWTSSSGVYWPHLVANDALFSGVSVFASEYYTGVSSGDFSVADSAAALLSDLKRPTEGLLAPLSFANIIFVCHSMGGVVVRYIIESNLMDFIDKNIGLVFMASPSLGSRYANFVSLVSSFVKHAQRDELKAFGPLLMDLDRRFKNLIHGSSFRSAIIGVEAIEHKAPFWGLARIVNKESAGRYFGAPITVPKSNHSTIVKPDGLGARSHKILQDFFRRYVDFFEIVCEKASPVSVSELSPCIDKLDPALVLFDVYTLKCEPYYLTRECDTLLEKCLLLRSVWVCGDSGVGKTSAVRRLLANVGAKPIEICLAGCDPGLHQTAVLFEIAGTICSVRDEAMPVEADIFNWVSDNIASVARSSPIALYLDEVPVSNNKFAVKNLLQLISTIIAKVKSINGAEGVRVVVSSIASPSLSDVANPGQLSERLQMQRLSKWRDDELIKLVVLIECGLSRAHLSDDFVLKLVGVADGSPRFVKNFFRNLVSGLEAPEVLLEKMRIGV